MMMTKDIYETYGGIMTTTYTNTKVLIMKPCIKKIWAIEKKKYNNNILTLTEE